MPDGQSSPSIHFFQEILLLHGDRHGSSIHPRMSPSFKLSLERSNRRITLTCGDCGWTYYVLGDGMTWIYTKLYPHARDGHVAHFKRDDQAGGKVCISCSCDTIPTWISREEFDSRRRAAPHERAVAIAIEDLPRLLSSEE